MRIGFDAKRIVRNATGLGVYGRTLVADLHRRCARSGHSLWLYAPDSGRDSLRSQLTEDDTLRFCYAGQPSALLIPHPLHKLYWRTRGIVSDLQRDGIGLFHGLTGELPLGLDKADIRSVVTIHDLIFMRHPEYYHALDARIYTWKFRQACRQADHIIAISERTRDDIVELGQVDPSRISVVYQSCNPRFSTTLPPEQLAAVSSQLDLPRHFVLSVGTIEERKNAMLIVKALPRMPHDMGVVLVGRQTAYTAKVTAEARKLGVAHRLRVLSGIDDTRLHALYQLAEVFAYPSRYEGFGIPIIEAIHSGLPVVAATGSCLEEAGGPDSIYVSPDDAEALAAAVTILRKEGPERRQRIDASRQYVRRFEGLDVAAQVEQIYQMAASGACKQRP